MISWVKSFCKKVFVSKLVKSVVGAAGSIVYKTESGSVGRVGGLSDLERFDAWENPERYIGKDIDVVGHKVTESGVIRQPHLYRIKED